MTEPKAALKPTDISDGLYVLGNVYDQVDGGYFAESPLATGILRDAQDENEPVPSGTTEPVTEVLVYSTGVPPTNWVAVTDRIPEPWYADVLCWDAGDRGCVVGYLSGFRKPNMTEPVWVADVSGQIIELKRVTHWTLLPEAPRTGK